MKVGTKENVADMLIRTIHVEKLEWSTFSLGLKEKQRNIMLMVRDLGEN